MLITVDGIVIARRQIGDNNLFLDILTEEYGVIEAYAYGAKKINSKNAAASSLFSYASFCLNKVKERYTVNSTAPKYNFFSISCDISKLALAAYFTELIRYTAEQPEKEVVRFFAMTLYELGREKADLRLIKAVFELRLSVILGLMPDLRACKNCICYMNEEMYFIIEESALVCGDCYDLDNKTCFLLGTGLLFTMRYIIYSKLFKIYKFNINENTKKELGIIAEEYLLYQLGRTFKTLGYYKNL